MFCKRILLLNKVNWKFLIILKKAPTISGDFNLSGSQLRTDGINRIGNLLVPNDNYCKFEDWIMPIFDKMVDEQNEQAINWTPSKIIKRLGKEIDNPDSIYYWAYKVKFDLYFNITGDNKIFSLIFNICNIFKCVIV